MDHGRQHDEWWQTVADRGGWLQLVAAGCRQWLIGVDVGERGRQTRVDDSGQWQSEAANNGSRQWMVVNCNGGWSMEKKRIGAKKEKSKGKR